MDEIETAAADTTSEGSAFITLGLPPLPECPYALEEGEPLPKRQKIKADLSAPGYTFPESGLQSLEKGSVRHYSGRVLPVGIAQPFHLQEQKLDQTDPKTSLALSDPKAEWDFEADQYSSPGSKTWEKSLRQALGASEGSDRSEAPPRFDKFTNERTGTVESVDNKETAENLSDSTSDSSDSTSDSDSSSEFEFDFVPPPMENEGREAEEEESGLEVEKKHHEGGDDRSVLVKPSTVLTSPPASLPLPPGKKWHVFVSHSTADKQWARETLILPLRSPPHNLQVAACYNFMPDSSRYDDAAIHKSLKESCVIMVVISPPYVNSARCAKEWKLAVHLTKDCRQCHLVAAAAALCSRPEELKPFLYLDFMDQRKHHTVWDMLMQTVEKAVQSLMPPAHGAAGHSKEESCVEGQGSSGEEEKAEDTIHRASQEWQESQGSWEQSSNSSGNEDNYQGYDMERFKQRMEAEFENDFQQFSAEEAFDGTSDHRESQQIVSDPRQMVDIAATGKLVAQVSREEKNDEDHRVPAAEEEEWIDEEEEEGEGEEDRGQIKGVRAQSQEQSKGGDEVEEGEVSDSSSEKSSKGAQPHLQSEMVASFYNKLAEPDADNRNISPIFHMRNFNNWVKSVLIRSYLPPSATVLDLCCGKGGDLLKWKEGDIEYLVCADISETSVEHCKSRYCSSKMVNRKTGEPVYKAEFIVADLCETRLREMYTNPARRFHLSSIQFSLHYSFESYSKAHMMLRNACENLRPGGYLIGTTVDADELVHRLRQIGKSEEGTWVIGNEVFSVTLDPECDLDNLPLFGAKYNFQLHEVVNLPEFLVHFPLLITMLKEFDMELVLRQNFYNFFLERRYNSEDLSLMFKMQAFDKRKGTMSIDQWEAIGLYLVFVFQKQTQQQ